jgi:hypothetical protein
MRSSLSVAVALAWLCLPASAAEEFITGLYLQSEQLCTEAKRDSLETVLEAGNTVLSSRGIEGVEYNCEFVQVTRATRAPAWLVQAVCQEPGYLSPDVLTILEMSPGHLDLISVKPIDPESGGGNGGSYFLCEGVALP